MTSYKKITLTNIYSVLIGYYSFFSVTCVSDTNLERVQKVQNRALSCIYRLKWDSPACELLSISKILFLR